MKQHGCTQLVYYELCGDMIKAIIREKQVKILTQAKKIAIIENMNPCWHDLWERIGGGSNENGSYRPILRSAQDGLPG